MSLTYTYKFLGINKHFNGNNHLLMAFLRVSKFFPLFLLIYIPFIAAFYYQYYRDISSLLWHIHYYFQLMYNLVLKYVLLEKVKLIYENKNSLNDCWVRNADWAHGFWKLPTDSCDFVKSVTSTLTCRAKHFENYIFKSFKFISIDKILWRCLWNYLIK